MLFRKFIFENHFWIIYWSVFIYFPSFGLFLLCLVVFVFLKYQIPDTVQEKISNSILYLIFKIKIAEARGWCHSPLERILARSWHAAWRLFKYNQGLIPPEGAVKISVRPDIHGFQVKPETSQSLLLVSKNSNFCLINTMRMPKTLLSFLALKCGQFFLKEKVIHRIVGFTLNKLPKQPSCPKYHYYRISSRFSSCFGSSLESHFTRVEAELFHNFWASYW